MHQPVSPVWHVALASAGPVVQASPKKSMVLGSVVSPQVSTKASGVIATTEASAGAVALLHAVASSHKINPGRRIRSRLRAEAWRRKQGRTHWTCASSLESRRECVAADLGKVVTVEAEGALDEGELGRHRAAARGRAPRRTRRRGDSAAPPCRSRRCRSRCPRPRRAQPPCENSTRAPPGSPASQCAAMRARAAGRGCW
jgi:hypothetical protein